MLSKSRKCEKSHSTFTKLLGFKLLQHFKIGVISKQSRILDFQEHKNTELGKQCWSWQEHKRTEDVAELASSQKTLSPTYSTEDRDPFS